MEKKLLTAKNIRITDFRLSVLNIFLKSENAITVANIENTLGKHDRITLYRTLKTFIQKGLIHEINLSGEDTKLALCGIECKPDNHHHNHLHFQCKNCHEVYCLPIPKKHDLLVKNFEIDDYEVIANGTCENCLT